RGAGSVRCGPAAPSRLRPAGAGRLRHVHRQSFRQTLRHAGIDAAARRLAAGSRRRGAGAMNASIAECFSRLGVQQPLRAVSVNSTWIDGGGAPMTCRSPIDGATLATFPPAAPSQVDEAAATAASAFLDWRLVPAPVRGQFVHAFAERLRRHKADLAALVTLEAGK